MQLVLFSLFACGSAAEAPSPDPEPPAPAAPEPEEVDPLTRALKDGDPKPTGKEHRVRAASPPTDVHPGDVLVWSIADSSPSVERSNTEWSTPTVSGDAVRYLYTSEPRSNRGIPSR